MSDPNEVKINPFIDTHGLSEKDYMESISAWREAISARDMPEPVEVSWVDTFMDLMNQPGIRRVLYQGDPRERSMLDVLTNSPMEIPTPHRRIRLTLRVDDSDNS